MSNVIRSLFVAACLAGAFAVVSPGLASAQIIGLRGGLSLASLAGDDAENMESAAGIAAGATATFPLSGNLAVQVGAAYVEKGAEGGSEIEGFSVDFDYIEVPVLLRLGIPLDGKVSPHVGIGPAVGFMIGCEVGASLGGATIKVDCDEGDLGTKSVDFGAMANAGVSIATSDKFAVTVDASYNFGFTTVLDDVEGESVDVMNRAWSFLVGVEFPIGK